MKQNRKHILLASLAIWLGGSLAFQALRILLQVSQHQGQFSLVVFIVAFAVYRRRTPHEPLRMYFTVAALSGLFSLLNFLLAIPLLMQFPLTLIPMVVFGRFVSVFLSAALGLGLAWVLKKFARTPETHEDHQGGTEPNNGVHSISESRAGASSGNE